MSNPTYTPAAFKPAMASTPVSLLRELFRATPLHLFATAAWAAFGKPTPR